MIIIDEGAVAKLIQAIKSLPSVEGKYCIRFSPPAANVEHARRAVVEQAGVYLPQTNLYFCEDGDIFILTHTESYKECKKALLAIDAALGIRLPEQVGEFFDLALQSGMVLGILAKKIRVNQQIEAATTMRQAREQAEMVAMRKRREILEQGVRKNAEQIAAQRKLRGEPVLMIVEDDPFSRRLVENVLQKQYHLVGLDSAERALSTYADIAPDMLLLDINLPDVTGHELLEKIIGLDPKAYVVMLSGNADKHNVMQALQRGAVGFLAKPFSRERLLQYILRCPTINGEKLQ